MARRGRNPLPIIDRFMDYMTPVPFSGCWLWEASTYGEYGQFAIDGAHPIGAHRASWLLHKGPIPDGLFVLHRCDVKICVNPDHLFLGTNHDNLVDYATKNPGKIGKHNSSKTICVNGHAYTPENTGRDRHGHRFCRQCARDKGLRHYRKGKV